MYDAYRLDTDMTPTHTVTFKNFHFLKLLSKLSKDEAKQYIIQINNLRQTNKNNQMEKTLMIRLANVYGAPTHSPTIKIAILDTTTGPIVTSSTPKDVVFVIGYVCSG